MSLNTDYLKQILKTLGGSLKALERYDKRSDEFDMFSDSIVREFEKAMETAGKLLRKSLIPYMSSSKAAWKLTYRDLFRQAARHSLLTIEEVERWLIYRDNRDTPDNDSEEKLNDGTLKILPGFISDARRLAEVLENA